MTAHTLRPASDTVTDVFDRLRPPVLSVVSGDVLSVETLDAAGNLERHREPGKPVAGLVPQARGHCLAGPIEVVGARPGQHLAVELLSLTPGSWGWTVAGARDVPLNRRLGIAPGAPEWLLWDLDGATARDQHGHVVDLRPFLGVIGMPPDEPGVHSTIPPRWCGGNLDCRELVAGSTLYLPVSVPGAMVCLGDGHGAQGNGEVAGSAVECPMTTELRLTLVDNTPVRGLHATTPEGRITFGVDPSLDEAMALALEAMLDWLQSLLGVNRTLAMAVASPVIDLRVTQIANDVWGVHAVLPDGALRLS